MKKSKIIVPAVALLALGLAASTTATVAWYTANSNATVKSAAATGSLSTTTSSIQAGEYVVDFTITPAANTLQLSHVATSNEATNGVSGIDAADLTAGDLIFGVVSNGKATMRKCADSTNFITSYSVSAEWHAAPTDPADIAYLNGKKFTVAIGVDGQAKLLGSNGVSGQSNQTSGSVQFTISYSDSTWTFTAGTSSNAYVHIEPQRMDDTAESNTTGAVTIAADQALTLS